MAYCFESATTTCQFSPKMGFRLENSVGVIGVRPFRPASGAISKDLLALRRRNTNSSAKLPSGRVRRRPPAGSGRRPSRRLHTPREFQLLASRVPPVVGLQLDTAWETRRSGVKAESHHWVNADISNMTRHDFLGMLTVALPSSRCGRWIRVGSCVWSTPRPSLSIPRCQLVDQAKENQVRLHYLYAKSSVNYTRRAPGEH